MRPQSELSERQTVRRIRTLLLIFLIGLAISGATALPLRIEINWAATVLGNLGAGDTALFAWIARVRDALNTTGDAFPFLAYGTDWLAFGHFMLALVFVGPLRDPVKNAWVIDFGMIACALVIPFALVMGEVRGIPFGWRLTDCSFGLVGIIPLWLCRRTLQLR